MENMKYFWIRVFDYKQDDELKDYSSAMSWENQKGTLLDEYYLCGDNLSRDEAKKQVTARSGVTRFAKPRKGDGIYAIIMDSNKSYYEWFTLEIDTKCFCCYKDIRGKARDFPCMVGDNGEKYYFCSYNCRREITNKLNPYVEGEFQEREDYTRNGGVYGYIYHIYNRKTNMHYIGQTVYMPFFRWQEHAKSGLKGDITDLVFETIAEVRIKSQDYLNSVEAWWIRKFIHEYGKDNVMNIVVPKITIEELANEYSRIVGDTALKE